MFKCFVSLLLTAFVSSIFSFNYPEGILRSETVLVRPKVYEIDAPNKQIVNTGGKSESVKVVQLANWILELSGDQNYVLPSSTKIEWIEGEDTRKGELEECDCLRGKVRGFDGSLAVLTFCGEEIMGYFNNGVDAFFVEPVNGSYREHVVYKTSYFISSGNARYETMFANRRCYYYRSCQYLILCFECLLFFLQLFRFGFLPN